MTTIKWWVYKQGESIDFRAAAELKNSALFVPSLATNEVVEGKRTFLSLTDVRHSSEQIVAIVVSLGNNAEQ